MRHLGIDYGTKKVGLALSDEGGHMAFPRTVIPNDEALMSNLEQLISDERVEVIVIGHSLGRDGAPNAIHTEVEELIGDLTLATGLPIHLEPEQYTSQAAARLQEDTKQLDAAAAALILDSFLQKQQRT
jgi:putative Holliday junction resolvase